MNKEDKQAVDSASYRFKITSIQNNHVIGTGLFTTSKKLNTEKQISFLHEFTNGVYANKERFVCIEVWNEL